jgi:hypothetical protein
MVYEKDLMAALAREVGDTDTSNLYYSANQLFSAINDGLQDYNKEMFQLYSVVGSGDMAYFSPDPGTVDQRLIVIFSARALMRGELSKQARQAIRHSNAAGTTDLTSRPIWTNKIIERYDNEIDNLKAEISKQKVESELEDGSMELRSSTNSGSGVEGLPITTITETV